MAKRATKVEKTTPPVGDTPDEATKTTPPADDTTDKVTTTLDDKSGADEDTTPPVGDTTDETTDTTPPVEPTANDTTPPVEPTANDTTPPVEPTANDTTPPVEPTANDTTPADFTPDPHHIAFFKQYIELTRNQDTLRGIKALNNCIKTVLSSKNNEIFEDIVELFKREKLFLIPQRALQSVSTVPSADRAKLEIIMVVMAAITGKPNMPINLDVARTVLKNDAFVDFIAKKLATAKR